MKYIIEREATFWKQFRLGGQRKTKTIITSICKGNTMKQDMLNSQIHLTSQAPRGSLSPLPNPCGQPLVISLAPSYIYFSSI